MRLMTNNQSVNFVHHQFYFFEKYYLFLTFIQTLKNNLLYL